MSGTRWHLAAALLFHLLLTGLACLSFVFSYYQVESCEVGLFSVSFTLPIAPAAVKASSSFTNYREGVCEGYAIECSHLCSVLSRVELAALVYVILAAIALALLLACLLHLFYLNCVRPIALTNAYLLHVGAAVLYVLAGFLGFLISGCLQDSEMKLRPGSYVVISAMVTASLSGVHYGYLRRRGFWGLSKLKYTELEGTHVGAASNEEGNSELTESVNEERRRMEMARAGRGSIQPLNTGEKKQGDVAGDAGSKETIEKLIVQLKQREDEVKQTRETCAHLEASLTELRAQLPSP